MTATATASGASGDNNIIVVGLKEHSFPEGCSFPTTEGFLYFPVNKSFYPEGAVNMLLAKSQNELVEATPQSVAECPACHEKVIAKCGTINIWHWAHKVKCVYDTEPETEWHLMWKKWARAHGLEIEHIFEEHITDAFDNTSKTCYEFQHSAISPEDMIKRSVYYKGLGYKTFWIFDLREKFEKGQITLLDDKWGDLSKKPFIMRFPRKTIQAIFEKEHTVFGKVYFDFGNRTFEVRRLYSNGNGWGKFVQSNIFTRSDSFARY